MKKFLLAGLLALPVAALTSQPASAWSKFNIGIGANLGWQSGGSKSLLWGAYKSGDTPLVTGAYQGMPAGGGYPPMAMYGMPPAGGIPMPAGGYPMPAESGGSSSEKGPMPSANPTQFQNGANNLSTMPVGFQTTNNGSYNSQTASSSAPYYWYDNNK